MQQQKDYLSIVNRGIDAIELPDNLPGLYAPIRYALEGGGKRLRPVLMLAACDAFGGDVAACLPAAIGVEVFHNFTLVHDDVMDRSDTRRGRPTVWRKWDVNTAILSGDAMTSIAYAHAAMCPPQHLAAIIGRFGRMTMAVYEGQQVDTEFETARSVSLDQYIEMIRLKTSALIAYPLQMGAVIGGASQSDAELMHGYGDNLGIAFQMQDDYLDVYGDAATFGKPIGGDILNEKKTWLHILACDGDPMRVGRAASGLRGEDKVNAVTRLYDSLGLRQKGREMVGKYISDALQCIERTSLDADAKQWFADFAHALLGRSK